jgi:predicted amidohydrolase
MKRTGLWRSGIFFLLLAVLAGCVGGWREDPVRVYPPSLLPSEAPETAFDLPPIRRIDLRAGNPYRHFATYGQCQIGLSPRTDPASGLSVISDEGRAKVERCVSLALREQVNVLILPELALAFREATRLPLMENLRRTAQEKGLVIVAGSFYDGSRRSRLPVIGPGWEVHGYKLKPSRFEASPLHGKGMREGPELLILETVYGRIVPLTCVDLISDAVQYSVRNLATRGQVDVVVNVNFNPAAWEFMIEANGVARRHPLVVSITNVSGPPEARRTAQCRQQGDDGRCFGHSALFASLRERDSDCPNCASALSDLVEPAFKTGGLRSLPYDTLAATVPPLDEAMLIYDLNLRLLREPAVSNAPDQGYPVVRNVRRLPLDAP